MPENYLVQHTTGLILMNNVQNERVAFDVVDRTIYDGTESRDGTSGRGPQRPAGLWGPGDRDAAAQAREPPDVVYTSLHDSLAPGRSGWCTRTRRI